MKKLFFKVSGQSLGGQEGYGIDHTVLHKLGKKLIAIQKKGYSVAIMTGAGNIFRGRKEGESLTPAIGHYAGMMATGINALVFGDVIKQLGAKVEVLSSTPIPRFMETFSKRRAEKAWEDGKIIVCACGGGNPFDTTDLASVSKALELDAEVVIKCTRVNGVYTADPEKDPNAQKIDKVSFQEVLEKGLNVLDLSAMALAMENKVPVYVCNMNDIEKRGTDELDGTLVTV